MVGKLFAEPHILTASFDHADARCLSKQDLEERSARRMSTFEVEGEGEDEFQVRFNTKMMNFAFKMMSSRYMFTHFTTRSDGFRAKIDGFCAASSR